MDVSQMDPSGIRAAIVSSAPKVPVFFGSPSCVSGPNPDLRPHSGNPLMLTSPEPPLAAGLGPIVRTCRRLHSLASCRTRSGPFEDRIRQLEVHSVAGEVPGQYCSFIAAFPERPIDCSTNLIAFPALSLTIAHPNCALSLSYHHLHW